MKSPKVYVRDSGLLHALLGIVDRDALFGHPKVGASWEGWIIENLSSLVEPEEFHFWATHQGAELDLLLVRNGVSVGVEIKRSDVPAMTPSLRIAAEDLALDRIVVIHPGDGRYPLNDVVEVVPSELPRDRAATIEALLGRRGKRGRR